MQKSALQKFQIKTIDRNKIKNAPYNPRKIKKPNKDSLSAAIKKMGLLETLVWNERTNNLISGHQRLDIIDALTGHFDYQLDMAVVDLSEKEEAEANIVLNNRALQGDFDFPKLREMAIEFDLDLSDDILDIKTAFSEFLDITPDPAENYEEKPETTGRYSSDKIPLAIIITPEENEKWEAAKRKCGHAKDTKAFIEVLTFYCNENGIQ